MDDLLGTLFYIIITVALIVVSALRKNKKQGGKSTVASNQTTYSSSKSVTDNSFWEELLGIDEQKPAYQAEAPDYQDDDSVEQEEVHKENRFAKQEPENKVSLTQQKTPPQAKEKMQEAKPREQASNIGTDLRKRKELRKAIIYSEIIKPKHF
jgi:FtsZ-interacting cell division protein ZipA